MNAAIASSINGDVSNQQVANASYSSLLLSSIDFSLSEIKTNVSVPSGQGKLHLKLKGKELFSRENKPKHCDLNKNPIDNGYLSMNGNKEKNSEDCIPVPKVQLYTGKIHMEWNQVYKIGAGLNNLGNTCFMNTVIQCLTYCPPLANYLLHDNDHASKCTLTNFCMMCVLQKHMKRAIGKTGEVIKPVDVYQRLTSIAKHFQFGRQEDAHEFLRYVIDNLWKSCLPQTNGAIKLDPASKETTVINKIFGGYHRSQVVCMRCKKESNTFDHFMDFILDIKQNVSTLEDALKKFTQPELLQQDNCYKCPKCKMKVEAKKRFTVYRAPAVATFQLKRFDYNRSFGGKITKQIHFSEKLNLRPYMSETQGPPVLYQLNAVLVHSGPSCNSGHYYCYVKNSNGHWYIMDDARVCHVNINQVLSQSAYVLFYVKMENTDKPLFKNCLDNKSSYMRGNISNSHISKVVERSNLKSTPFSDKISSLPISKPLNSSNIIKKLNSPTTQNREKISFGFRSSSMPLPLTPPKNKAVSSEVISASRGGLVPYVEDSSESSDASESNPSQNKTNSVFRSERKQHNRSGSIDSNKSSLQLSKSVFTTPSVCSSPPKVSATSSWIVTEVPQIQSPSSNSSGVNSTTNWHVIEAASPKLNDKIANNDSNRRESTDSPKLSMPILPTTTRHFDDQNYTSPAKKLSDFDNSPSSQKCNFRKQTFTNKSFFPEDKETVCSAKRKPSDLHSKDSTDSCFEHSENRRSPLPKKAKYAENSIFLNNENGVRNSSSYGEIVDNNSGASFVVQRHYSDSNCDNYPRTSLVNGDTRHNGNSEAIHNQSSILLNGTLEKREDFPEKDNTFTKGKHKDNYFSESFQYDKDKLQMSNEGKNVSLYGTEIPTWREDDYYRPSIIPGSENRRLFDSYDHEFDRGKVRKSKLKDRHQYFPHKNLFQAHVDRYHGKKNNNFYSKHHNHRKYDSHHNWKPNHSNNYQRYRNHHHRRY